MAGAAAGVWTAGVDTGADEVHPLARTASTMIRIHRTDLMVHDILRMAYKRNTMGGG
jgi:NAD(P)H-hydrate repair Nnr-like enzyme with NAD(P)H-hydrate dehydratase domain